jgi:LPS-assembly protein
MTSRTRFLITAAVVCHLLLAPPLVTSQLLSFSPPENSGAPQGLPNVPSAQQGEEVTMRALEQEKQGTVYKLRGQAEIHYQTYILYADEVTYDSSTGETHADGHVVLDGGPDDEHIEATHATYNVRTETGHFEHVSGTTGIRARNSRTILTSSSPFAFSGKTVDKTAPGHYVVNDGTVTSCELPHPKWLFTARKAQVDTGANAELYRSDFELKGIPIFYFPFAAYPVDRERRQSGFLLPSFGQSSVKGTIIGEGVYWAMNRSMDGTLGAEYFSKRGWAQHGEFRAEPSEKSFVDLNYFGVIDRGIGSPPVQQGGEDVRLTAESTFHHNFRAVADIDYLSSFVFRLAFNEVFTQAVYSEVKSLGFLSNTTNGYSYNASVQRYQNFESTTGGDVVTILHAPSFASSSVERQIGRSPFYWTYDAALEGLSRSEPGFRTANLVGRADLNPSLSLPLLFKGWSVRPELSLRDTYYTQRFLSSFGNGVALDDPTNRKALEGSVEVRPPTLERVFDREFLNRKWKHVIEPRVVYNYVTGVNNFNNILRFDQSDILSNTNEVEYAVVNRIYAKRNVDRPEDCGPGGMPLLGVGQAAPQSRIPWQRAPLQKSVPCNKGPETREVVTWELAQKYFLDPNFGGALVPGVRNVFTTTADLTGIAFLTSPRHLSPLISRLRINSSNRTDIEWDLDYDFKGGLVNASTVLANYHTGEFTFGAGDAYLREQGDTTTTTVGVATPRFNQFRLAAGYGHTNKPGFSGAASIGFDATLNFLQYASVQTGYNWDCCGLSIEYRRFALGSVRNENQYRFIFSLANIGAFGNLRRQDKLF